jgi:small subunit ribosomal protein S20
MRLPSRAALRRPPSAHEVFRVANTASAIKRVRQNARRVQINGPRRTAAKTFVAKAIRIASGTAEGDPAAALADALSALDRAAKTGAIHPNAAARRKSRLARKLNAALEGGALQPTARVRVTGKAASAKAARARVAAARARTEAGPKTAAGKARVALARTATGGPKESTATTAAADRAKGGRTTKSATANRAKTSARSTKSTGGKTAAKGTASARKNAGGNAS